MPIVDFIPGYYHSVGAPIFTICYAYGLATVCDGGLRPQLRDKRTAYYAETPWTTYHIGEAVELLPHTNIFGILDPEHKLNPVAQFVLYRIIEGPQRTHMDGLGFMELNGFLGNFSGNYLQAQYFAYAGQRQPTIVRLD